MVVVVLGVWLGVGERFLAWWVVYWLVFYYCDLLDDLFVVEVVEHEVLCAVVVLYVDCFFVLLVAHCESFLMYLGCE